MAIKNHFNRWFPRNGRKVPGIKDWVRTQRFDRLGCLPYSHEENTSAYVLEDDVPERGKTKLG